MHSFLALAFYAFLRLNKNCVKQLNTKYHFFPLQFVRKCVCQCVYEIFISIHLIMHSHIQCMRSNENFCNTRTYAIHNSVSQNYVSSERQYDSSSLIIRIALDCNVIAITVAILTGIAET